MVALIGALAAPLDHAHAQAGFTDMSVQATDSPDPVMPDGNITYTVTVTNHGPDSAPASLNVQNGGTLRFISLSAPAGWSCTTPAPGGLLSVNCSNASLVAGSSPVFTIVAQADSALNGPNDATIQSTFTVSTPTTDSLPPNDSATVTTAYVTADADLSVTLSAPATANVGDQITYSYTAVNAGPDAAANVGVTAGPQPGMTFVSLTAPAGWSCTTPAVGVDGPVLCTKASMSSGESANFTLVSVAPPSGPAALAVASIVSATADPNPANNGANATTVLNSPASADVSVTVSGPASVQAGQTLTFNISASNAGPDDASNVTLTDVLPAGLTFQSLSASAGWSCTTPAVGANGTITCTSPTLSDSSGSFTLVTDVALNASGTISNSASISADTSDPSAANNSSTAVVTVTPPAPTAGDMSVNVGYNTPLPIDVDVSGSVTSVAVASGPAHGATTVSGTTVTYTPTSGYYGPDSFTYTATGPGGTSAPATVSLTVATPAAPTVADESGVAVSYNSSGTAIDLSSSITGVYSSVAVGTAPSHGAVSVAGSVVTYTPTTGYFGADTFTYTATGPGGTSAPATVSLTVATPAAPTVADRNGVAVSYNSSGTAIDLSSSITGVYSSLAVATGPTHGAVSVAGSVVTYTPTVGYYGADSFTYTATGAGGTSAPATVSLTVATPAAPTAADKSGVAVSYNSSWTAIDLGSSITGVYSSVAVGTAPSHGAVSVVGAVVTYTPTTSYFGADSFTYTATGPGGTSAPATVSLTVAAPAAPTAADKSGVAVAYNSSGTAIDLSSSVTGVYSSLAVGTQPSNGTVSIANSVVTYTPATDYYGPDSFTYTATGPGGTSAPATVNLTVAMPPAPVASDASVTIPFGYDNGSAGYFIDVEVSGDYTSLDVVSRASHGAVQLMAGKLWYLMEIGYYGTDSFTYTATGPGGVSNEATVSITVTNPAAPTVQNPPAVALTITQAQPTPTATIDLSAQVSGVYTGITVGAQPAHGSVSLSTTARDLVGPLVIATYTADPDYTGTDTFTFVAAGPGGNATGTVSINITGTTPVLQTLSRITPGGVPITVDLTLGAAEGPFTAAEILSVTSGSGTATLVEGGAAGNRTYALTFDPQGAFTGEAVITYRLKNRFGWSEGQVNILVSARANISLNPVLTNYISQQVSLSMSFASVQVEAVGLRVFDSAFSLSSDLITDESGDDEDDEGEADSDARKKKREGAKRSSSFSNNLRFNGLTDLPAPDLDGPFPGLTARLETEHARDDWFLETAAASDARSNATAAPSGAVGGYDGPASAWVGGTVTFGRRDASTGKAQLDILSSGITAGVDFKLNPSTLVGAAVGYGRQITDIGNDGTQVEGKSWTGMVYGAYRPTKTLFLHGILGGGEVNLDNQRAVASGEIATGEREGQLFFGSTAVGFDHRAAGWTVSSYGRLDMTYVDLGAYAEEGAGLDNLSYAGTDARSLTAALGVRGNTAYELRSGIVMPSFHLEVLHDFDEATDQQVQYADWLDGPNYLVRAPGENQTRIRVGIGNAAVLHNGWTVGVGADAQVAEDLLLGTFFLKAEKEF